MLTTKQWLQSAMMIALLSIAAYIKVPIGLVPITFQFLIVLLIGLLFSTKQAILTVSLYILIGLLGVPVFSGGGGFEYIFRPSFGFVLGFLVCVTVTNTTYKKTKHPLLAVLLGYLSLYMMGLPYLFMILTKLMHITQPIEQFLYSYWIVFLLNDCLSIALSLLVFKRLDKFSY